nr:helix-turn-helix transcriptional regulator [Micromonospora sp. DSM 115978]
MSTSQFLIHALRRQRIARGWTQEELGARTNFSAQHVSAVELGNRQPREEYLTAIDRVFGTDLFLIMFEELVKGSDEPVWLREWVEIERLAIALRWFEPNALPGIVQTEAYAREIIARTDMLDAEEVERRLASRLERQKVLHREPEPPLVFLTVDEHALRRPVGGPSVMRAQLQHLLAITELPNVRLSVVPPEAGAYSGISGGFILARSPEGDEAGHVEDALEARVVESIKQIATLNARWDTVTFEARSQPESIALIREMMMSWS